MRIPTVAVLGDALLHDHNPQSWATRDFDETVVHRERCCEQVEFPCLSTARSTSTCSGTAEALVLLDCVGWAGRRNLEAGSELDRSVRAVRCQRRWGSLAHGANLDAGADSTDQRQVGLQHGGNWSREQVVGELPLGQQPFTTRQRYALGEVQFLQVTQVCGAAIRQAWLLDEAGVVGF